MLLKSHGGLDFSFYRRARACKKRMFVTNKKDRPGYNLKVFILDMMGVRHTRG